MKNDIFTKNKKDLTKPTHYTIKSSIIKQIKKDAIKYNISQSHVVTTILEEYYNNTNKNNQPPTNKGKK